MCFFIDFLGYRISVDEEADREIIADIVRKKLGFLREIDYFHSPKETGFKAFHLYINDFTEIQIMSTKMKDWTNETHKEHEKRKYGV